MCLCFFVASVDSKIRKMKGRNGEHTQPLIKVTSPGGRPQAHATLTPSCAMLMLSYAVNDTGCDDVWSRKKVRSMKED